MWGKAERLSRRSPLAAGNYRRFHRTKMYTISFSHQHHRFMNNLLVYFFAFSRTNRLRRKRLPVSSLLALARPRCPALFQSKKRNRSNGLPRSIDGKLDLRPVSTFGWLKKNGLQQLRKSNEIFMQATRIQRPNYRRHDNQRIYSSNTLEACVGGS